MTHAEADATCYLLHFDEPFHHAQHYLGVTTNLGARLKLHESGKGAKLLAAVKAAGISWRLVREWDIPTEYTPRQYEIKLKHLGGHGRLCPICKKTHGRRKKAAQS